MRKLLYFVLLCLPMTGMASTLVIPYYSVTLSSRYLEASSSSNCTLTECVPDSSNGSTCVWNTVYSISTPSAGQPILAVSQPSCNRLGPPTWQNNIVYVSGGPPPKDLSTVNDSGSPYTTAHFSLVQP